MGKCSESDRCGFLITILLKQSDQTNNQEKDVQQKVSQFMEIELNFMRWQLSLQKIRWHHLTTTGTPVELTLALGPRCFQPIGSRSSLHQHSYFSITSASSLAYPVGSSHDLMDISRQILVESRDPTIFPCTSVSNCSFMPCRRDKTSRKDCNYHDEKMPFLETPRLDPTKIGFD